jgi:hypothetical protein
MAERVSGEPAEGEAMTKARQKERAKHQQQAIRRGEVRAPAETWRRDEPMFVDPNGRRWAAEVEYLKHVEESAWLAAKFGPKDAYSDGELEEMLNDPQLNAILDKVEEGAAPGEAAEAKP